MSEFTNWLAHSWTQSTQLWHRYIKKYVAAWDASHGSVGISRLSFPLLNWFQFRMGIAELGRHGTHLNLLPPPPHLFLAPSISKFSFKTDKPRQANRAVLSTWNSRLKFQNQDWKRDWQGAPTDDDKTEFWAAGDRDPSRGVNLIKAFQRRELSSSVHSQIPLVPVPRAAVALESRGKDSLLRLAFQVY